MNSNPDSAQIEEMSGDRKREIGRLLETILRLAREMMNADLAVIVPGDPARTSPILSSSDDITAGAKSFAASRDVISRVFNSGSPELIHDIQTDSRYASGSTSSIILQQITSIICVPMLLDKEIVGVLYLDSRRNRKRFTDDNRQFVETFARMAAIAIDYANDYFELGRETNRLKNEVRESWDLQQIIGREIIGSSRKMADVFNVLKRVMNSDISVLLQGDSGTGKELIARALHYNGQRRDKPFIAQFCGNLSEELLESELFGHKKGSFTGAITDKKGLMEIADGGTFFLDEIADISPTIQAKLLRVIQEGEIRRVGDTEARHVNLRIISATNKNLKEEVNGGRFREDLYYRLNVITITLPPLRERVGDIPLLASHFIEKVAEKNHIPAKHLTSRALRALENYNWPGNVRELYNTIERAMILSQGEEIDAEDLFIPRSETMYVGRKPLKDIEREVVLKTLEEFGHNKTRTADALGVSLRWLHYKINEWKNQDS